MTTKSLALFAIINSLSYLTTLTESYGGTFDQNEVCLGKDGVVLKSDADNGAHADGWFAYSGSLIVCCEGIPYDVYCSEMMEGYCDCPINMDNPFSEYDTSIACYGRKCTSEIVATPAKDGYPVEKEGPNIMCWLPEDDVLKDQGYTNNVTVVGTDFCRSYHGRDPIVPPVPEKRPEETGTFELLVNQDTGLSSTGIVPVHQVMIPGTTRVVMWTRGQQPNVPAQPNTEFAISVVYDWSNGKYYPVEMDSNPFCSGVGYSQNGNILAFGGEQNTAPWGGQWQPTQIIEGRNKIREFNVDTNTWKTVAELPSNHWYPTQTLLEDGRILNQGGFVSMVGPQNEMLEIFNSNTNKLEGYYNSTEFAKTMGIMNLYPFFSFLPYTDPSRPDDIYLFMDLCNHAEMYTITKDNELEKKGELPLMGGYLSDGSKSDYCAAFSAVGFARFLPFKPPYNKPEYVAFGGIVNSTQDILDAECWADIQGSDKSFRISVNPEDIMNGNKVGWEEETMPFQRVGGLAVTLPNGEILIMNGAKRGTGNDFLREPVRTAVMYDPDAESGNRYRTLATSPIKRLYHNVAILLPNGNVMVAGGEQGEAYTKENGGPWCGTNYDYTYEAEIYKPPYVYQPELRPTIQNIQHITGNNGAKTSREEATFAFGETIRVYYKGPDADGATITSPSAVTHGTEMNSRTSFLETKPCHNDDEQSSSETTSSGSNLRGGSKNSSSSSTKCIELVLPKQSHRVTNTGHHMLFLLNGKSPSHEAKWIKIVQ